jgi:hypothetical protein
MSGTESKVKYSDTDETLSWLCDQIESADSFMKAWTDHQTYRKNYYLRLHSDWYKLLSKVVDLLRERDPSVYYKLSSLTKSPYEAEITKKMADLDIAPKLICVRKIGDRVIIGTQRYPTTLADWMMTTVTSDMSDKRCMLAIQSLWSSRWTN